MIDDVVGIVNPVKAAKGLLGFTVPAEGAVGGLTDAASPWKYANGLLEEVDGTVEVEEEELLEVAVVVGLRLSYVQINKGKKWRTECECSM